MELCNDTIYLKTLKNLSHLKNKSHLILRKRKGTYLEENSMKCLKYTGNDVANFVYICCRGNRESCVVTGVLIKIN